MGKVFSRKVDDRALPREEDIMTAIPSAGGIQEAARAEGGKDPEAFRTARTVKEPKQRVRARSGRERGGTDKEPVIFLTQ